MKVKQLKIFNFRKFDSLTLDFDPDEPTVFIGVNGSGKSSILDALAILLSWIVSRIKYDPSSASQGYILTNENTKDLIKENQLAKGNYISKKDIKNGTDDVQLLVNIAHEKLPNSMEESSFCLKGYRVSKEINLEFDLEYDRSLTQTIRTELRRETRPIGNEVNRNINIPLVVFYGVNRSVNEINLESQNLSSFDIQTDAYENALEQVNTNFDIFFQGFRAIEDLENEKRTENPDYRDKYLEAIRNPISSFFPEFTNLRVRRSPLRMTLDKNGEELNINQLSDGEKCLLAMLGDIGRRLAIANPGLDNPLQGEGVILIDEIELHLHPQWQRKIIPLLTKTFPNCQFIITTHSPQVISDVKWVHLIMENESGSLIVEKVRTYGKDSNLILETLMKTSERSQEGVEDFHKLFELIDEGKLNEAKEWKEKLIQKMGEEDPQFVKAGWLIRKMEIMKDETNSEDTTAEKIH